MSTAVRKRWPNGMDMATVVAVCWEIGVHPTATPHGVRVGTYAWRIESGGGIAGNGGKWWLAPMTGMYHPDAPDASAKPMGPASTPRQLARLLRKRWPNLKCAPRPHLCDGCNVRGAWEHRCHGEQATVRGERTDRPCTCAECRPPLLTPSKPARGRLNPRPRSLRGR
jgi:hypothetical protein